MDEQLQRVLLEDPNCNKPVEALQLCSGNGLLVTCVPARALDLYELRYADMQISYTRRDKGIDPSGFIEDGADGFGRNFFAGFTTTCGLIQSGRPCQEDGRRFGLHGRISNTRVRDIRVSQLPDRIRVSGVADEIHETGEHMRLDRQLTVFRDEARLEIKDQVTNLGDAVTPFMMMYHMNFGAPFLSAQLRVEAEFLSIEDRDTGAAEDQSVLLHMDAPGTMSREKVYYTQLDRARGVTLKDPDTGITCHLTAQGTGLDWTGIWKDFTPGAYALGIEPCNCPGLGRVCARERGLLPYLAPGELREHCITAIFNK